METGATLTAREARNIVRRLNTIARLTDDRRIKEQVRLVAVDVNKATRRVSRKKQELKLF